jgi:3-keto-5-aminohexanoate cleavage enzyme
MSDAPVIIEAALNGVTSKARNPVVPTAPDELARDAIGCIDAGATVVHTHSHDIAAPPTEAAKIYAAAYAPVVAARPDAILYPTTGIGATIEDRYGHVPLLAEQHLIRASFVDTGSVNLGGTGSDGLPPASNYVYTNTFTDIAYKFDVCERLGLGPSIAIFEPGFLRVVVAYARAGRLPRGTLVKFYFSAGGYLGGGQPLWGAPPIAEALDLYLAMLDDAPVPWAVAVLGGSLVDSPVARLALERGGHLRVGLEDFDAGPENVAQVDAARHLCEEVGRPVASLTEAAAVLSLPSGAVTPS